MCAPIPQSLYSVCGGSGAAQSWWAEERSSSLRARHDGGTAYGCELLGSDSMNCRSSLNAVPMSVVTPASSASDSYGLPQ